MTDVRLRPRTVSEIVDAAFALYRQHASRYMVAAAIGSAPLLVTRLLLQPVTSRAVIDVSQGASSYIALAMAGAGFAALVINAVALICYSLVGGLVITLGSRAYLGEDPDVAAAFRTVIPRVPSLIAAAIMKAILTFIGALVFLVGALYVVARFFATDATIMLEGKNAGDAFTRSSELSKDRKWHILATMLLVGIVYFMLAIGFGALLGLTGSTVLEVLASTLIMVVAWPIVQLTVMVLYYDMRIRGEGFDLEHMTAALDDAPTPVA